MSPERSVALVDHLRSQPSESGWLEFKDSNQDPDRLAQTISALANGARLLDEPFGYMVWGIQDGTHAVLGTRFEPGTRRIGNEPLEFWLAKLIEPSMPLSFFTINHPDGRVVLLQIPAADRAPVKFKGVAYIRIGEATPPLTSYPAREQALWTKLQPVLWERGLADNFLKSDAVLDLLDYPTFFALLGQRLPDNRQGILDRLHEEKIIIPDIGDRWSITNLGAILFAKKLDSFDRLARKSVRVVQYKGTSKAETIREQPGGKGYAAGFEGLISYIDGILPRNELIGKALREVKPVYPEISVRELVANALIHQDMTVTGAGPMVEIYSDRIEITNPGSPLIDVRKFIGASPRSRNEDLSALMRRMKICEERGSGIIKVLRAVEVYQLPAPEFRADDGTMKVSLYSPRRFRDMDARERVRACYQHAALKYVSSDLMTNATLRERLGVEKRNAAQVSRIINDTLAQNLIRPADTAAPRAGYVPFWA